MTSREPDEQSNGEDNAEQTEGEAAAEQPDDPNPELEGADSEAGEAEVEAGPLVRYGEEVATAVDGKAEVAFDTIKVRVPSERWVDTLETARDELGLPFFSFLGVIEWTNETATGDPLSEEVEERFEVLCTVADVTVGNRVTFSTDISYENPMIPSLVDVYAGANWHERESHEMFGVDFAGHPNLAPLYLPDGFVGNPLRKSFALLSREVKPWPGKVDVENMPEEEEEEEEAAATDESSTGEGAGSENSNGEAGETEEGES